MGRISSTISMTHEKKKAEVINKDTAVNFKAEKTVNQFTSSLAPRKIYERRCHKIEALHRTFEESFILYLLPFSVLRLFIVVDTSD